MERRGENDRAEAGGRGGRVRLESPSKGGPTGCHGATGVRRETPRKAEAVVSIMLTVRTSKRGLPSEEKTWGAIYNGESRSKLGGGGGVGCAVKNLMFNGENGLCRVRGVL